MNANHARPMAAFWLLALLAALVTVVGLRAAGRPVAEPPQPGAGARAVGSSDVVLGSRLHAEPPAPTSALPNVFSLSPVVDRSATARITPATTQASTQASPQARTVRSAVAAPKVTVRTPVAVAAQTPAAPPPTIAATLPPATGNGKHPHTHGKQTVVASARSASPAHGRGQAKGQAQKRAQKYARKHVEQHAEAHGQQHVPPGRAQGRRSLLSGDLRSHGQLGGVRR